MSRSYEGREGVGEVRSVGVGGVRRKEGGREEKRQREKRKESEVWERQDTENMIGGETIRLRDERGEGGRKERGRKRVKEIEYNNR